MDPKLQGDMNKKKLQAAYDSGLRSTEDLMVATGLSKTCVLSRAKEFRDAGIWEPLPKGYNSRKGILNKSTLEKIGEIKILLDVIYPQSVRQIFYGLVVKGIVKNLKSEYANVSNWCTSARLKGYIPWNRIVDRTRSPHVLSMFDDVDEFAQNAAYWYRSNWWKEQERRIVFWCEKDALSGVIWPVVKEYGIPLYVGKGFDSWSAIKTAADDFGDGENVTILYAGDLDTAGVIINRSLINRLAELKCYPTLERIALEPDQIDRWKLQPSYAKRLVSKEEIAEGAVLSPGAKAWDTRVDAFVAEYGDIAVELDAIPPLEFRKLIKGEVESRIDLAALSKAKKKDECMKERIQMAIEAIDEDDCLYNEV